MAEINSAEIGFEKEIWKAADKMRGNIDASEYKSVVLGLIFLKYISDKFEAKYDAYGAMVYRLAMVYLGSHADAEDAAAMGENLARDSMADIIKEETEAYILDKAADLHANLRVEVAVGEDNLPAAVTISGEASPYARRQIQAMIANDLGISKENQKWIG